MSFQHVIEHGANIGDKHVNIGGMHSDDRNILRLDGINNR
jgi:hypothetical protein